MDRNDDLMKELAEALRELVSDSMASDFNEHWDSFKAANAALARFDASRPTPPSKP